MLDSLLDTLNNLIVNGIVKEKPAHRTAGLPAPGVVHTRDRGLCHFAGVSIWAGDQGILAAQFENDRLNCGRTRLIDSTPGGNTAD